MRDNYKKPPMSNDQHIDPQSPGQSPQSPGQSQKEQAPATPSAENPSTLTSLRTGDPKKTAAGLPAVISSFKHVFSETGIPRGLKALAHLNQKDGFDCPSCAWPDPDDERSGIAEYCENGAKAVAEEATTKKLKPDFFKNNSVAGLASLTDYEIGKKGRIAQPMYLPKGATHYQLISWEDAFQHIANTLNELPSPDEAIFYTSGRTSNEAAFLYQLFIRAYGTNNLPDCSNMCHESSGVALGESLGIGKGSVTLEDLYHAEVILILGQNPGTNHPRMLTALQKAKAAGAMIISINPLPETGLMGFRNPQNLKGMLGVSTPLTDIFLQVKLNGDMALLQAIELLLWLEEERSPGSVFDHTFIEKNTEGYREFIEHLQEASLADLSSACGISIEQIGAAANALKDKKKIIACWAMGLTQHKNAVDTIKEVVNLLLLKGSIGKPGAGTCPVRGHSNVQGDRTVGIFEQPSEKLLNKIEEVFGFAPPRHHGYDVVRSIRAMHEGQAKVFFAMGGNFLSATPDTTYTAEALRRCRLTVHVSTKLNRSHLVHGEEALILPCLARSDKDTIDGEDQFVSCENSMGVVQQSKGVLEPISEALLSEPVIVCRLAKATLDATGRPGNDVNRTAGSAKGKINWDKYMQHYDAIRDDLERTIPGFEQYNTRVRKPGGFYLPNCNREGHFDTASGKAQFNRANPMTISLAPGEFMMMTIRSHDQFNTTIYGLDDRYRGIYNERRVIFMNEEDAGQQGLKKGDIVDLYNDQDGIERVARRFIVIPYSIPRGCTATYYPETNVLVPINSVADKSNTPVSKLVIITIRKQ
jgi:molybdopterin-dependent oxidoreductase alpha subunit